MFRQINKINLYFISIILYNSIITYCITLLIYSLKFRIKSIFYKKMKNFKHKIAWILYVRVKLYTLALKNNMNHSGIWFLNHETILSMEFFPTHNFLLKFLPHQHWKWFLLPFLCFKPFKWTVETTVDDVVSADILVLNISTLQINCSR